MQETESTLVSTPPTLSGALASESSLPESDPPESRSILRRLVPVYYILFFLLLCAVIPPLISVNRYQRRIAMSISQSLGRPVHLDTVNLTLFPLPGFTIQNLVVSEDPAFGFEPIIRANSVRATIRIASLWRRRVEFSSISFTEPSVNLVHLANGKWNLESILIQAARIQAAPTAQKSAGPAPRFPYIEATGARVNLKRNQEKMPISLTGAEFALWLPNPQEWHLRIEARPSRTDTNVTDTGTFRLEGTLARAASLSQVPIDLDAEWLTAPLGEATHLLLGRDAGIRGQMTVSAHARGTVGNSALTGRIRLDSLHREDFVPQQSIAVDLQCQATETSSFHSFPSIQCGWPAAASPNVLVTASIPDVRTLSEVTAKLSLDSLPINAAPDWLRMASRRIPADLTARGTIGGDAESMPTLANNLPHWDTLLKASLHINSLTLASPQSALAPLTLGDTTLSLTAPGAPANPRTRHPAPQPPTIPGLQLAPTTIELGGKEPATLDGRIDSTGYTLHLSGMIVMSRLISLSKALPQFGDGLETALPTNRAAGPVRLDLTATRPWRGPQTWQDTSAPPRPTRKPH